MKATALFSHAGFMLVFLVMLACLPQLQADITVRLSVKFILRSDGTRPSTTDGAPSTNIGMAAGFAGEIIRGNQILATTGRGFRLDVVEYLDIQPPPPLGQQDADYWFYAPARDYRQEIEDAATASVESRATWRWNPNAINIYVNNTFSGECSSPGNGGSISLGAKVGIGTVLHEVGHAMGLRHTHVGDPDCDTTPGPYMPADGDGLVETVWDHPCINNRDDLINALPSDQKAAVDTAWLNVMSYHMEDQFLDVQMDIWTQHGDGLRFYVCTGKTWFLAVNGDDDKSGDSAGEAFATIPRGLSSVGGADDILLLRSGTYNPPPGDTINTACTLRATRGEVTIHKP